MLSLGTVEHGRGQIKNYDEGKAFPIKFSYFLLWELRAHERFRASARESVLEAWLLSLPTPV
jgi:hypothetical protein